MPIDGNVSVDLNLKSILSIEKIQVANEALTQFRTLMRGLSQSGTTGKVAEDVKKLGDAAKQLAGTSATVRSFTGSFNQAGRAISGLDSKVKSLQSTLGSFKTSSFTRALPTASDIARVDRLQTSLKAGSSAASAFAQQLERVNLALRALRESRGDVNIKVSGISGSGVSGGQIRELSAPLGSINAELKQIRGLMASLVAKSNVGAAGTAAEAPGGSPRLAGGAAQAFTMAGGAMQRVNRQIRDFNEYITVAYKRVLTYATAASSLYAVARAFREGITVITETETAMAKLDFLMNDVVSNMSRLRREAFDLSKAFGFSISQTLEAMVTYAQQGRQQAEVIALTRASLAAANQTTLSAAEATESLTAAMALFGIKARDSIDIVDSWAGVANKTAVSAEVLTTALKKVGGAATAIGITFHEFNGLVATLSEATRKSGQEIGTSLKFLFQRLGSREALQALEDLGIAVFQAPGQFRPFLHILRDVSEAMQTLNDEQRRAAIVALAGTRHYSDIAVLLRDYDKILRIASNSQNAFGTSARNNAIVMETLGKRWQQFKTAAAELADAVGTGGLSSALKTTTDVLKALAETVNSLPGFIKGGIVTLGLFVTTLHASYAILNALSTLVIPRTTAAYGNLFGVINSTNRAVTAQAAAWNAATASASRYAGVLGTVSTASARVSQQQVATPVTAAAIGASSRTRFGAGIGLFATGAFLSNIARKRQEQQDFSDLQSTILDVLGGAGTFGGLGLTFGPAGGVAGASIGAIAGLIRNVSNYKDEWERAAITHKKDLDVLNEQIQAVRELQRQLEQLANIRTAQGGGVEIPPSITVTPLATREAAYRTVLQLANTRSSIQDRVLSSVFTGGKDVFGVPLTTLSDSLDNVADSNKKLSQFIERLSSIMEQVQAATLLESLQRGREEQLRRGEEQRALRGIDVGGGGFENFLRLWGGKIDKFLADLLTDVIGETGTTRRLRAGAEANITAATFGSQFSNLRGPELQGMFRALVAVENSNKDLQRYIDQFRTILTNSNDYRFASIATSGFINLARQTTLRGLAPELSDQERERIAAGNLEGLAPAMHRAILSAFKDIDLLFINLLSKTTGQEGATATPDIQYRIARARGTDRYFNQFITPGGRFDIASVQDEIRKGDVIIQRVGESFKEMVVNEVRPSGEILLTTFEEMANGLVKIDPIVSKTSSEFAKLIQSLDPVSAVISRTSESTRVFRSMLVDIEADMTEFDSILGKVSQLFTKRLSVLRRNVEQSELYGNLSKISDAPIRALVSATRDAIRLTNQQGVRLSPLSTFAPETGKQDIQRQIRLQVEQGDKQTQMINAMRDLNSTLESTRDAYLRQAGFDQATAAQGSIEEIVNRLRKGEIDDRRAMIDLSKTAARFGIETGGLNQANANAFSTGLLQRTASVPYQTALAGGRLPRGLNVITTAVSDALRNESLGLREVLGIIQSAKSVATALAVMSQQEQATRLSIEDRRARLANAGGAQRLGLNEQQFEDLANIKIDTTNLTAINRLLDDLSQKETNIIDAMEQFDTFVLNNNLKLLSTSIERLGSSTRESRLEESISALSSVFGEFNVSAEHSAQLFVQLGRSMAGFQNAFGARTSFEPFMDRLSQQLVNQRGSPFYRQRPNEARAFLSLTRDLADTETVGRSVSSLFNDLTTIGRKFDLYKEIDLTTESTNLFRSALETLLQTFEPTDDKISSIVEKFKQLRDIQEAQSRFFQPARTQMLTDFAEQLLGQGVPIRALTDEIRSTIANDPELRRFGVEKGAIPGIDKAFFDNTVRQLYTEIQTLLKSYEGGVDQINAKFTEPKSIPVQFLDSTNFLGRLEALVNHGIDIAVKGSLPFVPGAATGASRVPRDGVIAKLHHGEVVVPAHLAHEVPANITSQLPQISSSGPLATGGRIVGYVPRQGTFEEALNDPRTLLRLMLGVFAERGGGKFPYPQQAPELKGYRDLTMRAMTGRRLDPEQAVYDLINKTEVFPRGVGSWFDQSTGLFNSAQSLTFAENSRNKARFYDTFLHEGTHLWEHLTRVQAVHQSVSPDPRIAKQGDAMLEFLRAGPAGQTTQTKNLFNYMARKGVGSSAMNELIALSAESQDTRGTSYDKTYDERMAIRRWLEQDPRYETFSNFIDTFTSTITGPNTDAPWARFSTGKGTRPFRELWNYMRDNRFRSRATHGGQVLGLFNALSSNYSDEFLREGIIADIKNLSKPTIGNQLIRGAIGAIGNYPASELSTIGYDALKHDIRKMFLTRGIPIFDLAGSRLAGNEYEQLKRIYGKQFGALQQTIFHGTGAEETFKQIDLAHIGKGEGGALMGKGAYITNAGGLGVFYAEHLGKEIYKPEKISPELQELIDLANKISKEYSEKTDSRRNPGVKIPHDAWERASDMDRILTRINAEIREDLSHPTNKEQLLNPGIRDRAVTDIVDQFVQLHRGVYEHGDQAAYDISEKYRTQLNKFFSFQRDTFGYAREMIEPLFGKDIARTGFLYTGKLNTANVFPVDTGPQSVVGRAQIMRLVGEWYKGLTPGTGVHRYMTDAMKADPSYQKIRTRRLARVGDFDEAQARADYRMEKFGKYPPSPLPLMERIKEDGYVLDKRNEWTSQEEVTSKEYVRDLFKYWNPQLFIGYIDDIERAKKIKDLGYSGISYGANQETAYLPKKVRELYGLRSRETQTFQEKIPTIRGSFIRGGLWDAQRYIAAMRPDWTPGTDQRKEVLDRTRRAREQHLFMPKQNYVIFDDNAVNYRSRMNVITNNFSELGRPGQPWNYFNPHIGKAKERLAGGDLSKLRQQYGRDYLTRVRTGIHGTGSAIFGELDPRFIGSGEGGGMIGRGFYLTTGARLGNRYAIQIGLSEGLPDTDIAANMYVGNVDTNKFFDVATGPDSIVDRTTMMRMAVDQFPEEFFNPELYTQHLIQAAKERNLVLPKEALNFEMNLVSNLDEYREEMKNAPYNRDRREATGNWWGKLAQTIKSGGPDFDAVRKTAEDSYRNALRRGWDSDVIINYIRDYGNTQKIRALGYDGLFYGANQRETYLPKRLAKHLGVARDANVETALRGVMGEVPISSGRFLGINQTRDTSRRRAAAMRLSREQGLPFIPKLNFVLFNENAASFNKRVNVLGKTPRPLDRQALRAAFPFNPEEWDVTKLASRFGGGQLERFRRLRGRTGMNAVQRFFHGTPHVETFKEFDWNFIRTGEGGNMLGPGFYLSESSGIGHGYAKRLGMHNEIRNETPEEFFALARLMEQVTGRGIVNRAERIQRVLGINEFSRPTARQTALSNYETLLLEEMQRAAGSRGVAQQLETFDESIFRMLRKLRRDVPKTQVKSSYERIMANKDLIAKNFDIYDKPGGKEITVEEAIRREGKRDASLRQVVSRLVDAGWRREEIQRLVDKRYPQDWGLWARESTQQAVVGEVSRGTGFLYRGYVDTSKIFPIEKGPTSIVDRAKIMRMVTPWRFDAHAKRVGIIEQLRGPKGDAWGDAIYEFSKAHGGYINKPMDFFQEMVASGQMSIPEGLQATQDYSTYYSSLSQEEQEAIQRKALGPNYKVEMLKSNRPDRWETEYFAAWIQDRKNVEALMKMGYDGISYSSGETQGYLPRRTANFLTVDRDQPVNMHIIGAGREPIDVNSEEFANAMRAARINDYAEANVRSPFMQKLNYVLWNPKASLLTKRMAIDTEEVNMKGPHIRGIWDWQDLYEGSRGAGGMFERVKRLYGRAATRNVRRNYHGTGPIPFKAYDLKYLRTGEGGNMAGAGIYESGIFGLGAGYARRQAQHVDQPTEVPESFKQLYGVVDRVSQQLDPGAQWTRFGKAEWEIPSRRVSIAQSMLDQIDRYTKLAALHNPERRLPHDALSTRWKNAYETLMANKVDIDRAFDTMQVEYGSTRVVGTHNLETAINTQRELLKNRGSIANYEFRATMHQGILDDIADILAPAKREPFGYLYQGLTDTNRFFSLEKGPESIMDRIKIMRKVMSPRGFRGFQPERDYPNTDRLKQLIQGAEPNVTNIGDMVHPYIRKEFRGHWEKGLNERLAEFAKQPGNESLKNAYEYLMENRDPKHPEPTYSDLLAEGVLGEEGWKTHGRFSIEAALEAAEKTRAARERIGPVGKTWEAEAVRLWLRNPDNAQEIARMGYDGVYYGADQQQTFLPKRLARFLREKYGAPELSRTSRLISGHFIKTARGETSLDTIDYLDAIQSSVMGPRGILGREISGSPFTQKFNYVLFNPEASELLSRVRIPPFSNIDREIAEGKYPAWERIQKEARGAGRGATELIPAFAPALSGPLESVSRARAALGTTLSKTDRINAFNDLGSLVAKEILFAPQGAISQTLIKPETIGGWTGHAIVEAGSPNLAHELGHTLVLKAGLTDRFADILGSDPGSKLHVMFKTLAQNPSLAEQVVGRLVLTDKEFGEVSVKDTQGVARTLAELESVGKLDATDPRTLDAIMNDPSAYKKLVNHVLEEVMVSGLTDAYMKGKGGKISIGGYELDPEWLIAGGGHKGGQRGTLEHFISDLSAHPTEQNMLRVLPFINLLKGSLKQNSGRVQDVLGLDISEAAHMKGEMLKSMIVGYIRSKGQIEEAQFAAGDLGDLIKQAKRDLRINTDIQDVESIVGRRAAGRAYFNSEAILGGLAGAGVEVPAISEGVRGFFGGVGRTVGRGLAGAGAAELVRVGLTAAGVGLGGPLGLLANPIVGAALGIATPLVPRIARGFQALRGVSLSDVREKLSGVNKFLQEKRSVKGLIKSAVDHMKRVAKGKADPWARVEALMDAPMELVSPFFEATELPDVREAWKFGQQGDLRAQLLSARTKGRAQQIESQLWIQPGTLGLSTDFQRAVDAYIEHLESSPELEAVRAGATPEQQAAGDAERIARLRALRAARDIGTMHYSDLRNKNYNELLKPQRGGTLAQIAHGGSLIFAGRAVGDIFNTSFHARNARAKQEVSTGVLGPLGFFASMAKIEGKAEVPYLSDYLFGTPNAEDRLQATASLLGRSAQEAGGTIIPYVLASKASEAGLTKIGLGSLGRGVGKAAGPALAVAMAYSRPKEFADIIEQSDTGMQALLDVFSKATVDAALTGNPWYGTGVFASEMIGTLGELQVRKYQQEAQEIAWKAQDQNKDFNMRFAKQIIDLLADSSPAVRERFGAYDIQKNMSAHEAFYYVNKMLGLPRNMPLEARLVGPYADLNKLLREESSRISGTSTFDIRSLNRYAVGNRVSKDGELAVLHHGEVVVPAHLAHEIPNEVLDRIPRIPFVGNTVKGYATGRRDDISETLRTAIDISDKESMRKLIETYFSGPYGTFDLDLKRSWADLQNAMKDLNPDRLNSALASLNRTLNDVKDFNPSAVIAPSDPHKDIIKSWWEDNRAALEQGIGYQQYRQAVDNLKVNDVIDQMSAILKQENAGKELLNSVDLKGQGIFKYFNSYLNKSQWVDILQSVPGGYQPALDIAKTDTPEGILRILNNMDPTRQRDVVDRLVGESAQMGVSLPDLIRQVNHSIWSDENNRDPIKRSIANFDPSKFGGDKIFSFAESFEAFRKGVYTQQGKGQAQPREETDSQKLTRAADAINKAIADRQWERARTLLGETGQFIQNANITPIERVFWNRRQGEIAKMLSDPKLQYHAAISDAIRNLYEIEQQRSSLVTAAVEQVYGLSGSYVEVSKDTEGKLRQIGEPMSTEEFLNRIRDEQPSIYSILGDVTNMDAAQKAKAATIAANLSKEVKLSPQTVRNPFVDTPQDRTTRYIAAETYFTSMDEFLRQRSDIADALGIDRYRAQFEGDIDKAANLQMQQIVNLAREAGGGLTRQQMLYALADYLPDIRQTVTTGLKSFPLFNINDQLVTAERKGTLPERLVELLPDLESALAGAGNMRVALAGRFNDLFKPPAIADALQREGIPDEAYFAFVLEATDQIWRNTVAQLQRYRDMLQNGQLQVKEGLRSFASGAVLQSAMDAALPPPQMAPKLDSPSVDISNPRFNEVFTAPVAPVSQPNSVFAYMDFKMGGSSQDRVSARGIAETALRENLDDMLSRAHIRWS